MKILLTGGGTLGPVTPLLALVEAWRTRKSDVEFLFVGTPYGPERAIVDQYQLPFQWILPVRFPRFFSSEWFSLPFRVVRVMYQAWKLLRCEHPDVIVGAGGFTQVPLVMIGWVFRISSVILQTDVSPLLSTRFAAPFASKILVAWEETARAFPSHKTRVVGVPVRSSLKIGSRDQAIKRFALDPNKQTLLVFGGGTGSLWINERMAEIVAALKQDMNIVHITGRGKGLVAHGFSRGNVDGYAVVEYLENGMEDVYAAADLVVCRAGLGTISELSALHKPAILIPLPNSAQEKNARLMEQHKAACVIYQDVTSSEQLLDEIRALMDDTDARKTYSEQIMRVLRTDVADEMIQIIESQT